VEPGRLCARVGVGVARLLPPNPSPSLNPSPSPSPNPNPNPSPNPDPNPNPNRNPNQVWPDYPCNEQEGRGWLVQIEWVAEAGGQSTAQVRFVVDEEYDPQELDVSLARGLTLILTLFLPRTRTRTRTLALTPTPSLTPTSRPTPTVTR
jgi:hypothetical protein